jgi:hypothetical protein
MKFTIVWQEEAEQELCTLWMEAADRQSLADAADRIDRELQRNPASFGELQPDGSYELKVYPIKIRYDVLPDDCRVTVLTVWMSQEPE